MRLSSDSKKKISLNFARNFERFQEFDANHLPRSSFFVPSETSLDLTKYLEWFWFGVGHRPMLLCIMTRRYRSLGLDYIWNSRRYQKCKSSPRSPPQLWQFVVLPKNLKCQNHFVVWGVASRGFRPMYPIKGRHFDRSVLRWSRDFRMMNWQDISSKHKHRKQKSSLLTVCSILKTVLL